MAQLFASPIIDWCIKCDILNVAKCDRYLKRALQIYENEIFLINSLIVVFVLFLLDAI